MTGGETPPNCRTVLCPLLLFSALGLCLSSLPFLLHTALRIFFDSDSSKFGGLSVQYSRSEHALASGAVLSAFLRLWTSSRRDSCVTGSPVVVHQSHATRSLARRLAERTPSRGKTSVCRICHRGSGRTTAPMICGSSMLQLGFSLRVGGICLCLSMPSGTAVRRTKEPPVRVQHSEQQR